MPASALPKGSAPPPVALPHFPDRLHAFVWRNWQLVPAERLAAVVSATKADILQMGQAMGLSGPPRITADQQRRSYLTVIKRNWHLLPYEQLLALLGWAPSQMAFTLREDDFLFVKLGSVKPQCEPLQYHPPDEATQAREREMARLIREEFPNGLGQPDESLFDFVNQLSSKRASTANRGNPAHDAPRFCYSYFALYGDPLLEPEADPYPDGYLARLAQSGVNGVWLQAVLYKLSPFPWDPTLSARYEERLNNLRSLIARARKQGIGVYLYLNEPRAMPLTFFESRPQLKGVVEGDHAALCTSDPEVQKYLTDSVASICRSVPNLAGFFTISGSENLSNCWSHGRGANCSRCGKRSPGEVIAEVNGLFFAGIQQARREPAGRGRLARDSRKKDAGEQSMLPRLIVWDWGWADNWVEEIINRLPREVALMSVSEWNLPIERGGVESVVGEYSISAVGPGPRALRHWEWARRRGLKTIAKIQAGNTWELSAVPYIPALENVARHAANLREAKVDGLMLGWTLGGYPSPNLEVATQMSRSDEKGLTPEKGMEMVARRRFGRKLAPPIVQAWREFSAAFSEFPYHGGVVYSAPLQVGPANLFWEEASGYRASMVGFPYDDLDAWRAVYPPEVFIAQLEKVAEGFEEALRNLKIATADRLLTLKKEEQQALVNEMDVAEAAALHFRSTANQARFVRARRALAAAKQANEALPMIELLEKVLKDEIDLARQLHWIQSRDSRIGFEASNQYYYVPVDLGEKVLNCRDLLDRWLPSQRLARK